MDLQKEDQLRDLFGFIFPGEELPDQRKVGEHRNPLLLKRVAAVVQPAHHDHLLVLHPQVGFDAAGRNHRHRIGGVAAG